MRSILYVPANRIEFIKKIKELEMDVVTLDLEDSVPVNEKEKARETASDNIEEISKIVPVYVRVNSYSLKLLNDDLNIVVVKGLTGICIPKCESINEIKQIDLKLDNLERLRNLELKSIKIQLLIETAKGVINSYEMAKSSIRINSLIFGAVDFARDIKVTLNQPNGKEQEWARYMIVCAAVATNVIPIDCPYLNFHDEDGFISDTKHGAEIGYKGRIIIHPSQIKLANRLYSPSESRIKIAKEIVAVYETIALPNNQASVSYNGRMIAGAVYKDAKETIEAFEKQKILS